MNFCLLLISLVSALLSDQRAELVFAGDAMMHQSQIDDARSGKQYDFSDYFRDIKGFVDSADYAIVNLETPVAGAPYSGYPCFNAPESYADALKDAGFDLFMLANNHMLDRRDKGLISTLNYLDEKKIPHIGAYRTSEERDTLTPHIVNVNGFKIALLNYTFSTTGILPSGEVKVNPLDKQMISRDIHTSREHGAELVAVMPHWGIEYVDLPPAHVKAMCEFIRSLGVDMIIGGHPHVVQPMKMLDNPTDSSRRQLVVYSMGNFISGMKTVKTRGGAMVKVFISRESMGKAQVESAGYRLVYTVPPGIDKHRPGYHLVYPSDSVPDSRARDFRSAVEVLLNRHNIAVNPL